MIPFHALSTLLAVGGALCISFSAVFVKSLNMEPATVGFFRSAFATFALFAIAALKGEKRPAGLKNYYGPWMAGVFFAFDLSLWHRCVYLTSPGIATMLNNLQVIFVVLYGVLAGKRTLDKATFRCLFCGCLGLYLLCGSDSSAVSMEGVWWGLCSALCYAGSIVVLHRFSLKETVPTVSRNAHMSLMAALVLLTECLAGKQSLAVPDWYSLRMLASYAFVAQVAGWWLITAALEKLSASRASMCFLLQPCLAFVWDVFLFGRIPTVSEIAGGVLVLSAVWAGRKAA